MNDRSPAAACGEETLHTSGVAPVRRVVRRRRDSSGVALVLIMTLLMMLLAITLIGVAVSSSHTRTGDIGTTTNNQIQMSKTRLANQEADNLADCGIRAVVQWICGLSSPPSNTTMFTPLSLSASGFFPSASPSDSGTWTTVNFPASDGSQGSFKVRLYPLTANFTGATPAYIVESVGTYMGMTRIMRAQINQQNFAQYAYFTDQVGTQALLGGRTAFNGPVHMNNSNHVALNIIWDSIDAPSVADIFTWQGSNAFTMWSDNGVNNSLINWYKDSTANATAPSSVADWAQVSVAGQSNLPTMTSQDIPIPTSTSTQANAALGTVTAPTATGVYIPNGASSIVGPATAAGSQGSPSNGIYVVGNVDNMVLSATGTNSTTQVIQIYQNGNLSRTDITIDPVGGTTTMATSTRTSTASAFPADGAAKTFSGTPNGVIYTTGNIGDAATTSPVVAAYGGLSGTVANNVMSNSTTVSTYNKLDIVTAATANLNIDGSIQYANLANNATAALPASGILGMVSNNILITQNYFNPETALLGTAITAETVQGTMMAYNQINADAYATRAVGSFYLLGGYIASIGTPFGIASGAAGNSMLDGFQRIMSYDSRVATVPPPYYPGTSNSYSISSYQRVLTTLEP